MRSASPATGSPAALQHRVEVASVCRALPALPAGSWQGHHNSVWAAPGGVKCGAASAGPRLSRSMGLDWLVVEYNGVRALGRVCRPVS